MFINDIKFTIEYLENLSDFSKFLTQRAGELPPSRGSQLYAFFSNLRLTLKQHLRQLKSRHAKLNTEISIDPNIIFRYENPEGIGRKFHVSIGGVIKIKNSIITEQSLCIYLMLEHTSDCSDIPDEWKMYPPQEGFNVLRKFHFDFDAKNDDDSKPKFHLQYGGSFEEKYLNLGSKIYYKIYSSLDTPRIPQQPYDIIMLLDFALREFNLRGGEITNEKRWNNIVIKSEKLWLKPYYENLIERLNCSSRSSPLHRIQ
ncbi:hypothetical protein V9K52_003038 [Vibrio alginolyticus]|nr:hypothetical protein [Vibrio alginolyticus]